MESRGMRIGCTRIRNEANIIRSTLDRLTGYMDGVVVFDDCSNDETIDVCLSHPLVIHIHQNKLWSSDPETRKALETTQRQQIHDIAIKKYNPEWILYFDGDEHIYFDDIDWEANCTYVFRLFDVYITPNDVKKRGNFISREWIGSEYRDIPFLSRPPFAFYNRIIRNNLPYRYGGTVKHFGKGISVNHWEETCDYYINHLSEKMANGESISDKWQRRKGKAVHTLSDWGRPLIKWEDRFTHPDLISENELFRQGVKPL